MHFIVVWIWFIFVYNFYLQLSQNTRIIISCLKVGISKWQRYKVKSFCADVITYYKSVHKCRSGEFRISPVYNTSTMFCDWNNGKKYHRTKTKNTVFGISFLFSVIFYRWTKFGLAICPRISTFKPMLTILVQSSVNSWGCSS